MNTVSKNCPICGKELKQDSFATSRKDNETLICDNCSEKEAIDEFLNEAKKQ